MDQDLNEHEEELVQRLIEAIDEHLESVAGGHPSWIEGWICGVTDEAVLKGSVRGYAVYSALFKHLEKLRR